MLTALYQNDYLLELICNYEKVALDLFYLNIKNIFKRLIKEKN